MRKFLVIMDDSDEWVTALRFAATRASRTGGAVEVLNVLQSGDFEHWMGVAERAREEARQQAEDKMAYFAEQMQQNEGLTPELVIREGELVTEILAQIQEDQEIGVLVLAAGAGRDGPGPLISQLVGRQANQMRVPITVVPGAMTLEEIRAVC